MAGGCRVCEREGTGYYLTGNVSGLLAARQVHRADPDHRAAAVIGKFDSAALFGALSTSLTRASDWERFQIANYEVGVAGSARKAMEQLGLDPKRHETSFSRLMAVGKLFKKLPALDKFTITATKAAKLMNYWGDPAFRRVVTDIVKDLSTRSPGPLDCGDLLSMVEIAVDPATLMPTMFPEVGAIEAYSFQRENEKPFARIARTDGMWSAQFCQPMNAQVWRAFDRAMHTLMKP